MSDAPSLQPGTLLADKFRIESLLGAGAMGEVYAIRHELTRHRRALKLLHQNARLVPDIVRRFLDEASAAGRVGNPHLVETFDAGTLPSGEPYVVMELLDGETLATTLQRQGSLAVGDATDWVAQAAEGIEAAHHAGIIHRDLKPENLFLMQRDGQAFVKILDFGVSKFATESGSMSQTRAGLMYGSPAYMSPEQLMGSVRIDPRTDVFALGVVLYQCLTGQLPFDAPTLEALAVRILTGAPTPIEDLRQGVPSSLVAIVARALATDPALRYPSAKAFADALGPFRSVARSAEVLLSLDTAVHAVHPFGQSLAPPRVRAPWRAVFAIAALVLVAVLAAAIAQRSARGAAKSGIASSAQERTVPVFDAVASPRMVYSVVRPIPSVLEMTPTRSASSHDSFVVAHPSEKTGTAGATPSVRSAAPTPASSTTAADSLGLQQSNPFR